MSNEIPVSPAGSPFEQTTTPAIERANRLMGLRAHPGFPDAIRLIQELVQEAVDTCTTYPGWDTQMILVLKVRMQEAAELKGAFLGRINDAIQQGLDEAKTLLPTLPAKTADEILDQGDLVRQRVLQTFDEMDSRPSGSF